MTKKHFQLLALRISMITDQRTRSAAAEAVAAACLDMNARFDVERFYKACGLAS